MDRPKPNFFKLSSIVKEFIFPLLAFAIGLVVAYLLNDKAMDENRQRIDNKLKQQVLNITEQIEEKLKFYQYGLRGLKAAIDVAGLEQFNYQEMQAYTKSRDFEKEFTGARGLGLIRLIEQSDLDAFVEQAREDRPDGQFNVKQLQPHSNSLFIIQYIEPEYKNLEAVGLDIGSESNRRSAALKALSTNSVQLTAPITLVQANEKIKHGFLILQPIYQTTSDNKQAGRNQIPLGWTYAPLLIEEILASVRGINQQIQLSITDVSNEGDVQFFQYNDSAVNTTPFRASREVFLFGRTWRVDAIAYPSFVSENNLEYRNRVFFEVISAAAIIALMIFIIQLIYSRRLQKVSYQNEISKLREQALEQEVNERAKEVEKVNLLQNSILESSGYAIIATDVSGTITLFNTAAEKLLNYSREEMVGKHTPATFHLESEVVARAEELTKELGVAVQPGFETFVVKSRNGRPDVNDWTYVQKNGEHIPVKLSVTCLRNDEGDIFGYLGIAYDISRQLAHEKALAEAKEQAEAAAKAKSDFLANMSHEIRTPINGLVGSLQLLKQEELSSNGQEIIEKALYSSELLTTIVNDVLDISKLESGKLSIEVRVFSLFELIEQLRSECSIAANNKGIEFEMKCQVTHQYWEGDSVRIRQVLLNLVGNAIKFTEVGNVVVTIREDSSTKGTLMFEVTDSGIGMSSDMLSRLFERFEQADQTTTRKYGGTGLGLSITKSLVELMQGTIQVESQVGEGTRVQVSLPLTRSVESAPEQTEVEAPDLSGAKILVAEDNQVNQFVVKGLLGLVNADVHFAANGQESVDLSQKIDFDLILMDIQMPVMDGVEACKRIKKIKQHLPIIALTANAFDEDKRYYIASGFDGYLAKPIDKNLLFTNLKQFINLN